ncbi:MAG: ABC transporter transmembrane domain-containing protein, partial [Pseudomonadota bacterium]
MVFKRKSKPARPAYFSPVDRDNLRWFWTHYFKEKTPRLIVVFLLVIGQGAIYQQFLSLTDQSLRVIFENGAMRDLIYLCIMVFLVFVFRGIMSFLVPRLSGLIAMDAIKRLRQDLIAHVMTLDLAFFERTTPGEFILRLVHQTDGLAAFVGQATVRAVRDVATIVIVSGYLFYKQPLLFSIAALVIPILIFAMQRISGRIKGIQTKTEQAIGDYIASIEEIVTGMRTVKISNQDQAEATRLSKSVNDIKINRVRLLTAQAMAMPFVDFAAAFVYVLVIGGGGYVVLSPAYDVDGASIITFLLGLILIFDPGRRIAEYLTSVQATLIILDGVRSLHRETPTIQNAPHAQDTW